MELINAHFPYPIISSNKFYTAYNTSSFSFHYDPIPKEIGNEYRITNVYYELKNPQLEKKIESGEIKVVMEVSCPETLYTKCFEILTTPKEIAISKNLLDGKVKFCCFVYATKSITDFCDNDFSEDYRDISFGIDKNDVMGWDVGGEFTITRNQKDDTDAQSIFSILRNDNQEAKEVSFEESASTTKIDIWLPYDQFKEYELIKSIPSYKFIFFSIYGINALCYEIKEATKKVDLEAEEADIQDLLAGHKWLRAVMSSYKKATSKELDIAELVSKPYEISQLLLDYPITKAIDQLKKINESVDTKEDDDNE
jgi:hypothetical protein